MKLPLIPQPRELTFNTGEITLSSHLNMGGNLPPSLLKQLHANICKWLKRRGIQHTVRLATGDSSSLTWMDAQAETALQLTLDPLLSLQSEGYNLTIDESGIVLKAKTTSGLRYAVQTALQLLFCGIYANESKLPYLQITDSPQYPYRGLHLDVSRHFFSVEFICQYLDWMAELKLNKFHWHLTDDQGWRLESKIYPLLTEIGSLRIEPDGSTYGCYYTQDDIQHVVNYATELGIDVIPEIDLPGHCLAVLAAYPQFSCHGKPVTVWNQWGVSEDILCAGKDETLVFLKELFAEIAALFPGKYIHLGGDEAPKSNWEKCPLCQARLQALQLPDEEALQGWMIHELTVLLQGMGKEVIGWDEILDSGIDTQPLVMVWRGDGKAAAAKASQQGNRYILCPNHFLYFDWKPTDKPDERGAFGVTTAEKVYSLNPAEYAFEHPELLQGGQANVWTERMHTPEQVQYMLFPRIYPLAEILWADPGSKDWAEFSQRMEYWWDVEQHADAAETETALQDKSRSTLPQEPS